MAPDFAIEDDNLSHAWTRAVKSIARGKSERAPLVVSITGFQEGAVVEDIQVRRELNRLLASRKRSSVETVANTIFPVNLWNPDRPRAALFARYDRIRDRVLNAKGPNGGKLSPRGTYFDRLVRGGAAHQCGGNQLDFVIDAYLNKTSRRTVLQCAVFDPKLDHSATPRLGFPCLQHLSFTPTAGKRMSLNAFYASQYLVQRAYGNYLGLCRLGRFVANELGLELVRVTCFTGLAQLDGSKRDLAKALEALERSTAPSSQE